MGAGRRAAFFDVDGTLAKTDIVRYYIHLRTRTMSPLVRTLWTCTYLAQVVRWLVLDRIDRARMNRAFYRGYRGMEAARTKADVVRDYPVMLGAKVFAVARARVAEHQKNGDVVVLLTGSLDFIVGPLATDLDAAHVIAATMGEENGRFTGELLEPPLGGERKAEAARAFAEAHGIDLAASYAYGDSTSDLAILSLVGHGVAVNPGRSFAREAQRRGFAVERWSTSPPKPSPGECF